MDTTSICYQISTDADLIIKLLGIIGGIIVFIVGLRQYRISQKWKKSEFLAKEMKEFHNNPDVERAFIMLDWISAELYLLPSEQLNSLANQSEITFDDNLLILAFSDHLAVSDFGDKGFRIRQIIDSFLYELGNFQIYLNNSLITKHALKDHIYYWLRIIAGEDIKGKNPRVILQLQHFIDFYEYENVKALLKTYGFNINYVNASKSS